MGDVGSECAELERQKGCPTLQVKKDGTQEEWDVMMGGCSITERAPEPNSNASHVFNLGDSSHCSGCSTHVVVNSHFVLSPSDTTSNQQLFTCP